MAGKKNVVVVGGGGTGAQVARALSDKLDPGLFSLILISPREYFVHLPGTIRMAVTSKGGLEDTVLTPYDKLFLRNNGTFLQATVISIVKRPSGNGGRVVTDNGDEVDFEVLILATGSQWEGAIQLPPMRADAMAHIRQWRGKFKAAQGVAIVGGGPVGSEMAGEIRDTYSEKPITIIHDKPHLLSDVYPDKFRKDIEHRLTQRHVRLVLDDAIHDIPAPGTTKAVTEKGVRIEADLVVPARGGRPNTTFITSLSDSALTSQGYVKVESTLQLVGYPEIFACGDIIDWKEVKQVGKYGGHVTTITTNVLNYINGQPPSAQYKSMFEGILISNGVNGGGSYMDVLWGICFGNWFTRLIKSKDLFITRTRQSLGY